MAKTEVTTFPFAKRLAELETIVAALESPETELEEGIKQYETGMKLVSELSTYLETAANRVETIKRTYVEVPDVVSEPGDIVTDELPF